MKPPDSQSLCIQIISPRATCSAAGTLYMEYRGAGQCRVEHRQMPIEHVEQEQRTKTQETMWSNEPARSPRFWRLVAEMERSKFKPDEWWVMLPIIMPASLRSRQQLAAPFDIRRFGNRAIGRTDMLHYMMLYSVSETPAQKSWSQIVTDLLENITTSFDWFDLWCATSNGMNEWMNESW